MIQLLQSGDPVLLSWLTLRLKERGIAAVIFDDHTSAAYAGALPGVQARVMVAAEDLPASLVVLEEMQALKRDD